MQVQEAKAVVDRIIANVGKVILGKDAIIRQVLACWLGGGHLLIEDVPGTGKTMLARAMALSVQVTNRRVQFTPDLLPSDIIGTAVYSREKGQFVFMPGPIFTGVLLADEINRATPRTQSALLQAMAEGQCTAENNTYNLPDTFFVIATQNPIEQHGTFPLPEAQLDRFMMRISLGYPGTVVEQDIIRSQLLQHPIENLGAVSTEEELRAVRSQVRHVEVSDSTLSYAMRLVDSTRRHPEVALGASPRATIALIRGAQAYSLISGLQYIKPDFIKALAPAVLEHRIVLTTRARLESASARNIVNEIVIREKVPVK